MLNNALMPVSLFLLLLAVWEERIQNPIDQGLAWLSATFRQQQENTLAKDRQRIIQLAEDGYLLITEFILATIFIALSLFSFLMYYLIYVQATWWGREVALITFFLLAVFLSRLASHRVDLAIQGRELYIEEKQLAAFGSITPDETAYLLSTSANTDQLAQAKQEYEAGQWVQIGNLEQLDKLLR
jgi:hypothetical protein